MLQRLRKLHDENESGFTLIELLVVIMIIGILSAIAVPTFLGQRNKAYSKSAMAELASLALAEESVTTDTGSYVVASTDASLAPAGYKHNPSVTVHAGSANSATAYCFDAVNASGGSQYVITNTNTSPQEVTGSVTACA